MIWTQDIPTIPGIYFYKKRKNGKPTIMKFAISEVKENTGWFLGPLSCAECVFWVRTGFLKSGKCKYSPQSSDDPHYASDWCGQFNTCYGEIS
jgi:hypothetical protein